MAENLFLSNLPRFRNPQGSITGFLQQMFTDLPSAEEFEAAQRNRQLDLKERELGLEQQRITAIIQKYNAEAAQDAEERTKITNLANIYRTALGPDERNRDVKGALMEVISHPDFLVTSTAKNATEFLNRLKMIQEIGAPPPPEPVTLSEGQGLFDPVTGARLANQPRTFSPQTLSPGQVLGRSQPDCRSSGRA